MKENNTNYHCGIGKEKSVARKYKRNGALSVTQMPGSRGAYDLEVAHPSRKIHFSLHLVLSPSANVQHDNPLQPILFSP